MGDTGEQPRTLKAMLAAAKDTSELMLDLAYATLAFQDLELAEEVPRLHQRLGELIHDMRVVCLMASRSAADAAGLAPFLRIVSAIDLLGHQAVDIAKIVTGRLGLPAGIRADLAEAEEVTERLAVHAASHLDGTTVRDAELTVHGVRLLAIRRGRNWVFDPPDDEPIVGDDVLLVRGPTDALNDVRALCGEQPREPLPPAAPRDEVERAVDALVEMKNLSELGVALAYATLLTGDRALAVQASFLEDRLDQMRETVESWALSAPHQPSRELRGLLHLAVAAETVGDAAQDMVWPIEHGDHLHPVAADALGEAEDTVATVEVAHDAAPEGRTLADLRLHHEYGMSVLAVAHAGRWTYRPPLHARVVPGDRVILYGPREAIDPVQAVLNPAESDQD